jgi:hypothetical protein
MIGAATSCRGRPASSGDDERAFDLEPRRGIAERRLHRRLVTGCDRGAEAEVAREQLGGVLEFLRTRIPQAVVDGA